MAAFLISSPILLALISFCFFSSLCCKIALCISLWYVEISWSSCNSSVYSSSVPDPTVTFKLSPLQQNVTFHLPFQRLGIICTKLVNKPLQPLSTSSPFKLYRLTCCTDNELSMPAITSQSASFDGCHPTTSLAREISFATSHQRNWGMVSLPSQAVLEIKVVVDER